MWVKKRGQLSQIKDTVRGGRVAEISAHSIQRSDWPSWLGRARTANHSAESGGPIFRLLFLLSRSPWPRTRRPGEEEEQSKCQPNLFSAVIGRPGSDEPGRPITAQNPPLFGRYDTFNQPWKCRATNSRDIKCIKF